MERGDEIIDITMTDKNVVLYNNKCFRSAGNEPQWSLF
jgi:hypothetical protein